MKGDERQRAIISFENAMIGIYRVSTGKIPISASGLSMILWLRIVAHRVSYVGRRKM